MQRNDQYILDEKGQPVAEPDLNAWAKWMSDERRRVAYDEIDGDFCIISTFFLGIDRSFEDSGPPVLWETMIFGGEHDEYQERYSGLEAARAGHDKALRMVQQAVLD